MTKSEFEADVTMRTDHAPSTITRVDLSEAVYSRGGLSRKESAALVKTMLSELADSLYIGETVKLSSFGSFVVRDKKQRVGRNPKTGVEVPISQRRVLLFKASNVLKAHVNGDAIPLPNRGSWAWSNAINISLNDADPSPGRGKRVEAADRSPPALCAEQ